MEVLHRIADRLVDLVVPRAEASASHCFWSTFCRCDSTSQYPYYLRCCWDAAHTTYRCYCRTRTDLGLC
jgi:hypothetical protein